MTGCHPECRRESDPALGAWAPVQTRILSRVRVATSAMGSAVGLGVFADEPIPQGTIIAMGGGQIFSDYSRIPPDKDLACVFDEGFYIGPIDFMNPTSNWRINHSCDPNVKVVGRLILLARRFIPAGEELCVDYSTMAAGETYYTLTCQCGSPQCRGVITGNDWQDPVLFERFYEEWPPFIQREFFISGADKEWMREKQ